MALEIRKKRQLFQESRTRLMHEVIEGKISDIEAVQALEELGEKLTGKTALQDVISYLDQANDVSAEQQEKGEHVRQ